MKLAIKPIYGWGWSGPEGPPALDVPEPFDLDAPIVKQGTPFEIALGHVQVTGHPLDGLWIWLSPRHTPFDGFCNLQAFDKRPEPLERPEEVSVISGFAKVDVTSV
jgi:hypothetical protein